MMKVNKKDKRKLRVRSKIFGTKIKPRLSVYRSARAIYVQLINDNLGVTLASASDLGKSKELKNVGEEIAKKAKKLGIKTVVFDRGGYKYHGRVKVVAESARKSGLKF